VILKDISKPFLLLAALCLAVSAFSTDVHVLARAVDDRYNHLRSLQAEFTEIYRGPGVELTESGTLWLKKPGKMRWEYRSPREKLFLSDGKNAWFYLPADRQAWQTPMRKLDDLRSPLALLLGKTKLEKELQALSLAPDASPSIPGNIVLRGVPNGLAGRVNQVMLEITPADQIARILLEEQDGSVTEYVFKDPKENVEITEDRFRFVRPPGVELIEGEFGQ
jgi:outer membrane lipoprotein carrier protein